MMNHRPSFGRVARCVRRSKCNCHASCRPHRSSFAKRDNASSSNSANNDCPHRAFAKAHPKAAADILTVPPVPSSPSSFASMARPRDPFSREEGGGERSSQSQSSSSSSSLENYLEWRGWDVEGILRGHDLDDDSSLRSAIGLLSHPLTFPLTLGRHVRDNLLEADDDERSERRIVRICCVGARAECTLPDDFWREFLVSVAPAASSRTGPSSVAEWEYTIDFVGPDVPRHLQSKTIAFPEDGKGSARRSGVSRSELTMNFHSSHLHEIVLEFLKASRDDDTAGDSRAPSSSDRTEKIRRFWNGGFALFNPGLGHPNLEKMWRPTLKFIVGTGGPVLLTAHSAIDARRDRLVLEEACGERLVSEYEINPHASRMEFVDPFPSPGEGRGVHVVRPNHSCLVLR